MAPAEKALRTPRQAKVHPDELNKQTIGVHFSFFPRPNKKLSRFISGKKLPLFIAEIFL